MGFGTVGKIISVLLIMGSGVVLSTGIIYYRREKQTGINKKLILIYCWAANIWAMSFGILGLCNSFEAARICRVFGIFGVDIFLTIDFCIVTELTSLKPMHKKITKGILIVGYIIDIILFATPMNDSYMFIQGYVTWRAVETIGRKYHVTWITFCFVIASLLGVSAYSAYKYQRQKRFLITFAIANVFLAISSLFDTMIILGNALPTSGLGAIICTLVLLSGAQKDGAFDISIAGLADKIYETMTCGIIILDGNKEIKFLNSFCNDVFGEHKYIGKKLFDIFDVSCEDMSQYFESAEKGEKNPMHLQIIGSQVKCSCQLSCVLDNYNDPQCYIMSFIDITNELNMLDELKELNAVKTNFLASMSHEIRTPINSIIGMNEMIRRESNDEKIVGYSANVDRASHQLLAIINDILDYSNIESGNVNMYVISYDVSSMIHDMYHVVSQRAESKGLDFNIHVNPMIPSWLIGDEVRINQIIMNLIQNAIKYTDNGFVACDIDFETIDDGHINMIISVRDSGRGIENSADADIFGTFAKIDAIHNQTIEGTGLGLAITKSLLNLMNGSISVESIFGVGSRFTVIIPQKVSNSAPVGEIEKRITSINKAKPQYIESFTAPSARILVVDDVEMNLMVVEELLKSTKMHIDRATGGYEALRKCNSNDYNVILMDHMMPGIDGIETLRRIRGTEGPNQNTPVVVLTANAIVGMREKYMEEGFSDYLTKPIDGSKLEATIKALLPKNLLE